MEKIHLASIDCGQSGGKIIDFSYDGRKINYETSIAFDYDAVDLLGKIYTDITGMYSQISTGIASLVSSYGKGKIASASATTWGGGYVFFNSDGIMLGNSINHRDPGVYAMADRFREMVSPREYYDSCGTIFTYFVAPNMLLYDKYTHPAYETASFFLPTPSTFNYFMSGEKAMDETIGTAMGIVKLDGSPNRSILGKVNLRTDFLPAIAPCGSLLGPSSEAFARKTGDEGIKIICGPGHDTAACLPAVPGLDEKGLFISMGTMMLTGIETKQPCMSTAMFQHELRTVSAPAGRYISYGDAQGFWLMNQCIADFTRRGEASDFLKLEAGAEKIPAGRSIIDTNDPVFYLGDRSMPERIREYCRKTKQEIPTDPYQLFRCLMDSYTLNLLRAIKGFEEAGRSGFDKIHLVNGGSRSKLLCSLFSQATGLPVYAGMRYASAAGNALTQLQGLGELSGMSEMRLLARNSFEMKLVSEKKDPAWDAIFERAEAMKAI